MTRRDPTRPMSYTACALIVIGFWTVFLGSLYAGTHRDGRFYDLVRALAVAGGLVVIVGALAVVVISLSGRLDTHRSPGR